MLIQENVSLKLHSTMRLGGTARYACEVTSEQEVLDAIDYARTHHLPIRTIGSGSNIVWRDEGFPGLLIVNKIPGFEPLEDGETVVVGAGTIWDDIVQKTVDAGLSGIEFLSLIPGTSGATPVQNVGAYGQEIRNVLLNVHAFDMHTNSFVDIPNDACAFGYRSSRFKSEDSGRFIITSITLKLNKSLPQPPFYDSLQRYLDDQGITDYSPASIRRAVTAIRRAKLPDPAVVANNGSFFANPVIAEAEFQQLQSRFPDIKGWPVANGVKVAAGWLVQQAGFDDRHDAETGMATWAAQNLVLVNEHAQSTQDLLTFKQKIVQAVHETFGIVLEQEPEILP